MLQNANMKTSFYRKTLTEMIEFFPNGINTLATEDFFGNWSWNTAASWHHGHPYQIFFFAYYGLKIIFLTLVSVNNDDEYTRHT